MLGDQDPPTALGPAHEEASASDADWLRLQRGGARPRALDSRWRRLGSEFRGGGGGKGERPGSCHRFTATAPAKRR